MNRKQMTLKQRTEKIQEIESLVKNACFQPTNVFGTGIWDHHIRWVVKFGKMLAEQNEADLHVVELAALLHDYASIKSFALYTNHHIHGAQEADRILSRMGFDSKTIENVCHSIMTHRGSMQLERKTPEALCLADADAMAHFVGVPSLLHYATEGKKLSLDESRHWVKAKLHRSWEKLSPSAKSLAKPYYLSAMNVLNDQDKVTDILLPLKESAIKSSHSQDIDPVCI